MISSNVGSNLYELINKNLFLFRYNKYKKDNIAYILHDPFTKTLTGIDFGDFAHTKKVTEMIERKYNSKLKYLISTHSHYDHTDGNKLWKKYRENTLQIIGGYSPDQNDTIPYADKLYKENQIISLSRNINIKLIYTPGHMKSSYCFYLGKNSLFNQSMLFTGDTLYVGSISKVYNGNYNEYYQSLLRIRNLKDKSALIMCAHDFTHSNLKFCYFVDSSNETLHKIAARAYEKQKKNKLMVGISTLQEEIQYNPFLRCDNEFYKKYTNQRKGEKVLEMLRTIKTSFDNWNKI